MPESNRNKSSEELTVGALRTIIATLPALLPVKVHVGWDWPVEEWDATDEELVLFADTPEGVLFLADYGLDRE